MENSITPADSMSSSRAMAFSAVTPIFSSNMACVMPLFCRAISVACVSSHVASRSCCSAPSILPLNRVCSVLYGTPEHGQPIVGNGVILKEGFVDGERDFVEMTEKDQLTLVALMVSFGNVVLRPESEVS